MDIKSNTERVAEMNSKIESLLHKTAELREQLANSMKEALSLYGSDYPELEEGDQKKLGALVNNSKSLAQLMIKDVE